MNIIKSTSTTNTTAAAGRKILYIVEHYTAGTKSTKGTAKDVAGWFSQERAQASADFIVDDAEIVQYNPDPENRYCWSVGGSHYGNKGGRLYGVAKNSNSISIEICSTNKTGKVTNANDSNWYFTDAVLDRAVELTQYLMKKYGIDADHVIRHYDVNGKPCPGIIGWNAETGDESKWNAFKNRIKGTQSSSGTEKAERTGLQAAALKDLSEADVIKKVGALFTADMKKSGILASVSLAQFIQESGFGKSELAQGANNVFGMKTSLSGNTWSGSSWDGKSVYTKQTQEDDGTGKLYTITADFRKYNCVEDSIADHSAYLNGAMNGSKLRYAGLKGCTDYKKAIQIIKDGGYATDSSYVNRLIALIEKWNLTQYDTASAGDPKDTASVTWYRVRKTWADSKSQLGAFKILANAKAKVDANPGFSVFDDNGNVVYAGKAAAEQVAKSALPYLVRISIPNLNIRKGPGTNFNTRGIFTGIGTFTIVKESSGAGSSAGWGLLKAYQSDADGWVSLDYCEKV